MKSSIFFLSMLIISVPAFSQSDSEKAAMKFVPGATVSSSKNDEILLKTPADTLVEIELNRDNTLDEASGKMAQKDVFVPGNGLLTLKDAVASMKKQGKEVNGEWSLDKDLLRDWEYEFEGTENGKAYEYSMNAKTGKIVKSEVD